jgi:hypothetical protein
MMWFLGCWIELYDVENIIDNEAAGRCRHGVRRPKESSKMAFTDSFIYHDCDSLGGT